MHIHPSCSHRLRSMSQRVDNNAAADRTRPGLIQSVHAVPDGERKLSSCRYTQDSISVWPSQQQQQQGLANNALALLLVDCEPASERASPVRCSNATIGIDSWSMDSFVLSESAVSNSWQRRIITGG